MVFGQLVIGPPGSGKSTYCTGMADFLRSLGRRVAIVNLDPANDVLPYECDCDVRELISLDGAAAQRELGPNGGLVHCMEYLEANVDWLLERLASPALRDCYVLLDMPGQVELYTHHGAVRSVVHALAKANHRLVAVHLVDAHHCSDPAKFISVLLVTLSTMVQLEMPQVNFLSKIDLIETYGEVRARAPFPTRRTAADSPPRALPTAL
jgi:GTPase SAR1 family protein